ncbi:cytochrome b [Undibacterium sp. RTI2.1]|uniref:cytochrome b n=1 Tax=unclassified Undibacterium TaxID=2630295 RepID=UPI002AB52573|nr:MULTISPECIES: cytochrome b [unclassified Undibacterium]MDY7538837.1 cytochrome b [Undibacterium sp. 5I1]MEB0033256.1 cytochrome b [Undibacterium sp. RTI2.1]MEB0117381.1 cytochrome b [Undibacterium sp. RTI2.2]MEB0230963.1 cytochrome b [Undibacterium sp. 10I3]MEB0258906.1 cytochrome b [Undibacterium sp. 5I1]
MQRYSRPSILLHWLVAILIIAAFILGNVMADMSFSPTKLKYFSWHKWLGVTILGLVATRLLTRLFSTVPAYPDSMPGWQKKSASALHGLLYILMFAIPLSGYFYTSAAGYPVVYLGLIQLPTIIGPNAELKPILKDLHEILTKILFVVFCLHVAAAFKHLIINKDGIFQRMLPGK